ncbi:MAG: hypothetical protein RIF41_07590 [Polyangiaceae bacterium]
MRTPTEKQYRTLINLASGSAGLSWTRRDTRPLLNHGWVTAELRDRYYQWVRITPDGLRAVALAVEKYGLPDFGPSPKTHVKVCCECKRDWRPKCSCGSRTYRHEERAVECGVSS